MTVTALEEVVGFLESFVDEPSPPESEAPVELTVSLDDSTHPLVYDPYNERLKLYGVCASDLIEVESDPTPESLVSKVTAYARPGEMERWKSLGFRKEGVIRGFFSDGDAHLWAAYPDEELGRDSSDRETLHRDGVRIASGKDEIEEPSIPSGFNCRMATDGDAEAIAELMTTTFPDYPSVICPEIIRGQMASRSNHFRLVHNEQGQLVAVASAEIDHQRKSVEMTDCATRASARGQGLMLFLLKQLEGDVLKLYDIRDLYTLARADEVGMNCVFGKLGYEFSGRLVNNCRMPNGWESMNVWCKRLLGS